MAPRIHTVHHHEAGRTVLDWLCTRLGLSKNDATRLLSQRKVRLGGNPCSNPAWRLRVGQRLEVNVQEDRKSHARSESTPQNRSRKTSPRRRTVVPGRRGPQPLIRYVDEDLVIVDKPAGLTTMRHADEAAEFGRGKRYLPTTLADLLPPLVAAEENGPVRPVRAVHRIDKDTSGLVVFARTVQAEAHLGEQFRAHRVERRYLALVRGLAKPGRIESSIVRDRGDGRRGSGPPGEGQHAVTHVEVLETFAATSLVECRLETGRTHQVRIHLGEAGTPLCGERVYDRPLHGRPAPEPGGIDRVALHAATLGVEHPRSGQQMRWTSPLPADMARLLDRWQ